MSAPDAVEAMIAIIRLQAPACHICRTTIAEHEIFCNAMGDKSENIAQALAAAGYGRLDALDAEQWRPIESAPKDAEEILIAFAGGYDGPPPCVGSWDGTEYVLAGTHLSVNAVPEYWRPLPAAPKTPEKTND